MILYLQTLPKTFVLGIISIGHKFESTISTDVVSIVYILIGAILWVFNLIICKIFQTSIPISQMNLYRSIFMMILNYMICKYAGYPIEVSKYMEKKRLWRNIFASQNLFIWCLFIYWIPISELTLIDMTSLIIISIMDYLLYNTKYTKIDCYCCLISFIGVCLILKPNLFSSLSESLDTKNSSYAQGWNKFFLVVIFYISLVIWCYSAVMLKELKNLNTLTLNFPTGFINVIFNAGFMMV